MHGGTLAGLLSGPDSAAVLTGRLADLRDLRLRELARWAAYGGPPPFPRTRSRTRRRHCGVPLPEPDGQRLPAGVTLPPVPGPVAALLRRARPGSWPGWPGRQWSRASHRACCRRRRCRRTCRGPVTDRTWSRRSPGPPRSSTRRASTASRKRYVDWCRPSCPGWTRPAGAARVPLARRVRRRPAGAGPPGGTPGVARGIRLLPGHRRRRRPGTRPRVRRPRPGRTGRLVEPHRGPSPGRARPTGRTYRVGGLNRHSIG
ncbi:hypothetical protein NKG94_27210 [Micromonospora sp. M12]